MAQTGEDAAEAQAGDQRYRQRKWADAQRQRIANPYLQEALRLEPDLRKVLTLARRTRRVKGYARGQRWTELKYLGANYVGNGARLDALATYTHYDAMIDAVDGLLPADVLDDEALPVYPGGDEVGALLATRPVLPRQVPSEDGDGSSSMRYLRSRMDELDAAEEAQAKSDRAWLAALEV